MRRFGLTALAAGILAVAGSTTPRAHGLPPKLADDNPEVWKYRLCTDMAMVAVQAVKDRDQQRQPRHYAAADGPGPQIANAIVARVFEQPAISSPKRAEAFGRGYCNEELLKQENR